MSSTNTVVCEKITTAIEMLEHCVETSELDIAGLAELLHGIRNDATKMENGLKIRKQLMQEHGLEEAYQKEKSAKNTPKGINKLATGYRVNDPDNKFEFILKNNGEVVYKNEVISGVICVAEEVFDFDENGQMNGTTQRYMFGQTLNWWYCFNQLEIALEAKKLDIVLALREKGYQI